MIASDVIEKVTSPYCSPIVLPKKKDGRYRFCIDYRRLNDITIDAAQPVPHIADALKDLGDASIFTSIDLKSGQHSTSCQLAGENTELTMTGETDLKIEIQGAIFDLNARVSPDIRHPLVLGLPWLKKDGCVVDLTQDVVYLGQQIRFTAPLTHCAPREQLAIVNVDELYHGLTGSDLTRLLQLLKEHSVVFIQDGQKLPRTRTVKHVINVATEKPFKLPLHRESETKQPIERRLQ
ncbi:hypothetical protein TSAR_016321 [Trichomalopsis sarcophagae]|uniref:Reverse transcriptase domain-containing protein n=1 Tax=Trichomalopsis sarcophagae TaxID=543379 RepID=A0A232EJ05_9HYME|nr:hypothetical protein TSAR_016321 [Trichomalopsis sarcophagae]